MKGNAFSVDLRWREKVSNETRTTAVYLTTARTNLGPLISLLMQCPAPADERPLVDRLIGNLTVAEFEILQLSIHGSTQLTAPLPMVFDGYFSL